MLAVHRGARLLVGRCSQDDGAPPLWPWQQVLRGLGADLDVGDGEDEGAEFRTWEAIIATVSAAAAGDETIVVVLDDLHWADVPTLRVLRLLSETVESGRLLVLGTWRTHPEPTGALADVAESLARRHAARLELTGLTATEAATVVEAVAEVMPDEEQAGLLASRTDGNPFFLVEYARLAHDGGDLSGLMSEADPPTAVSDVLARRLERLPEESRSVLRWAGVIGRFFDLDSLAASADISEDDVLDRLDPALEAGLVREEGIGSYLFGHALVRDAIYGSFSATRRARAHARVAEVLEGMPDRESETARHWLAAGPSHAGRAWRAARSAGGVARRMHAHDPAAELLAAAIETQTQDPDATLQDRYDLLMDLADAHRWRGAWADLLEAVEQAIETADEMDDVRLLARAVLGDDHRRPVAVRRSRRDPRHCRGSPAPSARGASRRGRPAPLPGDARTGQRALLQRQLRGTPRARGAGARHGPAAGRRRAGAGRLRGRVRVAVAARYRRAAAGARERGDGHRLPARERAGVRGGGDADRGGARRVRAPARDVEGGRRGP